MNPFYQAMHKQPVNFWQRFQQFRTAHSNLLHNGFVAASGLKDFGVTRGCPG